MNHKHCAAKCYANKAYRAYPSTKTAWNKNFELAKTDLDGVEAQLTAYLKKYKKTLFRIHVSGDFFSQAYLDMWKRIAETYPAIRFLAYTKVYWLDYSDKPNNLEIVLSTFETMPNALDVIEKLSKKYNLPIAHAGQEMPEIENMEFIDCPWDCETCQACWFLSETKSNVFFKYH